jgi:hypothetical protein
MSSLYVHDYVCDCSTKKLGRLLWYLISSIQKTCRVIFCGLLIRHTTKTHICYVMSVTINTPYKQISSVMVSRLIPLSCLKLVAVTSKHVAYKRPRASRSHTFLQFRLLYYYINIFLLVHHST